VRTTLSPGGHPDEGDETDHPSEET
jgi:hypothetical protein